MTVEQAQQAARESAAAATHTALFLGIGVLMLALFVAWWLWDDRRDRQRERAERPPARPYDVMRDLAADGRRRTGGVR